MNLKRLGQILILTAVVLAVFAAWSVQNYVSTVQAKYGTTVKVVVAAQPIQARAVITEKMLDYHQIPLQAMLVGMVRVENQKDLIGQTLLVSLRPGDVLTKAMIGSNRTDDPNLRTYSMIMSERVLFPDGLANGDQVDLLASYKDKEGKQLSKVILTGIKVLEVKKEDRLQVVVLAVSAGDAETLAWYENFGQQVRLLRRG